MLIKCTIFYTKRCMYEQKWEYSYKETPVLANAGSGVFLIKGFFYSPLKSMLKYCKKENGSHRLWIT